MAPKSIPENPYVSIQKDTVMIRCNKSNYTLPLNSIEKIHISKHKSTYWKSQLSKFLAIPETSYDLTIQTTNDQEIKISLNLLQRFYFIRLINVVRGRSLPTLKLVA